MIYMSYSQQLIIFRERMKSFFLSMLTNPEFFGKQV